MWWKSFSNLNFARNNRRLRLWESAVEQCGMCEVMISGAGWRARLTARSGPIALRISDVLGTRNGIEVEVDGPEGFSLLKLRRQAFPTLRSPEVEIGDRAFDEAFIIESPVRFACAFLDAKTRRQLLRASAECRSLEIDGGRLRVMMAEEDLPRLLPLLLAIAQWFADPADAEQRILRNARRDPEAGARLLNLRLLIGERPGDPETLEALRDACTDTRPAVRLRAAIELGDEGCDILLKLADSVKDDACSAQAVSHLGGKLPIKQAKNFLSRALRKGLPQTARACVEELGRRGAAAIGLLTWVMKREKGGLAIAAAQALGTTGEAAAEPALVEALRSEDSDLREAAAAALGKVGSVAAVVPLQDAAERSWLDLGVRRAARQAIAEIQSRREGASPGQLSLTEAEAGQLSLAQAEAGQLSLPPER